MRARTAIFVALVILAVGALTVKMAFEPPVPTDKLASIKSGMTEEDVRGILGAPTKVIEGGLVYSVNGTNYVTGGQWTYTRPFTFGYVNVLFDTNRTVKYAHREQF